MRPCSEGGDETSLGYDQYLYPRSLLSLYQYRMRNASILVAGMRALSNEVCKNIVLAGVGSITILEHETVTEEDLGAQFFIRREDIGRNVWTSGITNHVSCWTLCVENYDSWDSPASFNHFFHGYY